MTPCWEYVLRGLPRCTKRLDSGKACPSPGLVSDTFSRVLYCGHHAPVTIESRSVKARERTALKKAVKRAYGYLWR
jgi:hypothetical protein